MTDSSYSERLHALVRFAHAAECLSEADDALFNAAQALPDGENNLLSRINSTGTRVQKLLDEVKGIQARGVKQLSEADHE